ncbi:MAG: hypothetical protein IIB46_03680 [Nitrospinae bacterium]|nr:hypothetical protein [Nitrospinota bacterium]MCH8313810.1 hypothetical protein [Nitrospinota bacterium]
MRHLEKAIIFIIMLMVLIYTVRVDRNFPQNRKVPITKIEIPVPVPQPVSKKKASFFPESEPSPEDEGIIEETFTEVP